MGWHFKQPMSFKPIYRKALIHAKAQGHYNLHFLTEGEVSIWMQNFRHYRWCVRHPDSTDIEAARIEAEHSIRVKAIEPNVISIVCNPIRLSTLIALNPWIDRLPMETI